MTTVQRTDQGTVIGALELRQDIHRAYWRGTRVDLSLHEFTVVCGLATQAGDDVPYRRIYDLVKGRDFAAGYDTLGLRSNVRCAIRRIRKKFRAVDPEFDRIENYPTYGYRWRDGPYSTCQAREKGKFVG